MLTLQEFVGAVAEAAGSAAQVIHSLNAAMMRFGRGLACEGATYPTDRLQTLSSFRVSRACEAVNLPNLSNTP